MRRFGVCSFNANEEEKRVKEEGGGVALCSLQPRYHALCLQWMYRNREPHTALAVFWIILEHTGVLELYLNNIILYIDIYII